MGGEKADYEQRERRLQAIREAVQRGKGITNDQAAFLLHRLDSRDEAIRSLVAGLEEQEDLSTYR